MKNEVGLELESLVNDLQSLVKINSKSINSFSSLYSVDGTIIGTGQADYTQDATEYNLKNNKKKFCLIDIPGIEGKEKQYKPIIEKALNKAHVIIYVSGSDKKIEPRTIEKIKSYLRNDTEVYFVCNVHCKGQLSRTKGIDKSYSEELKIAYEKAASTVFAQSENELKEILGENYKNGMLINGLQGLSAVAVKDGLSTLIPDTEAKMLQSYQTKYFHEYDDNIKNMKKESHIDNLNEIIKNHTDNYVEYINKSNTRKFVSRLKEASEKIDFIEQETSKTVKQFIVPYDRFIESCDDVYSDFERNIDSLIQQSVESVINKEIQKICNLIDEKKGKVKEKDIQAHFDGRKQIIEKSIETEIKQNYEEINKEFHEQLQEEIRRFSDDIEFFKNKGFEVNPEIGKLNISKIVNGITASLKYNWKDFGKDFLNIGFFVLDGVGVGLFGGPVGGIIGGAIGAFVGIGVAILRFFQSKDKKIADAKKNAEKQMWIMSDEITNKIEEQVDLVKIKDQMKKSINETKDKCTEQKNELKKKMLHLSKINKFIKTIKNNYEGENYGKL